MIQPLIGNSLRSRVSEKKIKLHDIQPTESLGSSVTGKICLVCTVNLSSYCCPQCFIPYCSSQCYLRHGADCTEAFSRQRVKAVLDLEAKENIQEPAAVQPRKTQYGKFTDESEQILEKVSQINLDRHDIDEDENDPDILDDESTDNNDTTLQADFKELGEDMDVNVLKQINPRALSRLVKLWVPWWVVDAQNRVESLGYSKSSVRRTEISAAMARIAVTAPRLNTLISTSKVSKNTDMGYQILGLILGYVVSMRALNGEWQDMGDILNSNNDTLNNGNRVLTIAEECSSATVEATEYSLRSYDALEVICSSTPSLDPLFRPCSVLQTIELWTRFRPSSLQNISRKNLKSVLEDALSIIKYSEFIRFSLIEIWLIALSCELNDRITQHAVEQVKQFLKNENYVDFARHTLPLMDSYSKKFVSKPPKKKPASAKTTASATATATTTTTTTARARAAAAVGAVGGGDVIGVEGGGGVNIDAVVDDGNFNSLHNQADMLARKSYFLLLYAFDEINFEIMKNLAEELNEYITTYLD